MKNWMNCWKPKLLTNFNYINSLCYTYNLPIFIIRITIINNKLYVKTN